MKNNIWEREELEELSDKELVMIISNNEDGLSHFRYFVKIHSKTPNKYTRYDLLEYILSNYMNKEKQDG